MLTLGQSVFRITLNRGVVDGVLFNVEELKVDNISGQGTFFAQLVNREGKNAGRYMSSKFDASLKFSGSFLSHSLVHLITNILDLDKTLLEILTMIKANSILIREKLQSELNLLLEDSDSYLKSKGLDKDMILSKKEKIMNAAENEGVDYSFALKMKFFSTERVALDSVFSLGTFQVISSEDLRNERAEDDSEEFDSFRYSLIDNPNKKLLSFYEFSEGESEDTYFSECDEHVVDNDLIYCSKHLFAATLFNLEHFLPIDFSTNYLISNLDIIKLKETIESLLTEYVTIYTDYYNTLSNRNPDQLLNQLFLD